MNFRKATLDDIELLIKLRMDYLREDRGILSQEDSDTIQKQLRAYFTRHLPDGSFIGIVAESERQVFSVAFLAISEKPANLAFITGKTGTLMNVFTYPEYRRQGLATQVIYKIIEEARLCGVSSIELSASSDGKPLYEKLGFREPSYTAMRLRI